MPASCAAFSAISRVMRGSERVICSSTVPGTREKCCSTQPMQLRRSRSVMAETSTPPTVMVPERGGIEPQQQLEHRAFPGARAACQRDLLALSDGQGEVGQHGLFPVAEGHVGEHHVAPGGGLPLRGDGALRLGEEGVDALDAGHGRLEGLYLHAQTLDRGEDAGDVVDDRHRGAH